MPLGFGANHNQAFLYSQSVYFVIVNPDIRATELSLNTLILPFSNLKLGACAPLVLDSTGCIEESARSFPTAFSILKKVFKGGNHRQIYYSYTTDVDWLAGMFIVFRSKAFLEVSGFDANRFYMYYEDVDICRRLHKAGWFVKLQPAAKVVHDAQKTSHKNFKYFRWHVTSLLRYLTGI